MLQTRVVSDSSVTLVVLGRERELFFSRTLFKIFQLATPKIRIAVDITEKLSGSKTAYILHIYTFISKIPNKWEKNPKKANKQ